jgi:hypothetical protein
MIRSSASAPPELYLKRFCRYACSARDVGLQLTKDPTNHGVEKEPTESEEPSNGGEWSGEVDPPGVP